MSDENARAGAERLEEIRRRFDAIYGRELIVQLLEARAAIPRDWLERTADDGFEYLRCRLRFSQAELGRKSGMTQARVSRIEGGLDVRLSVWRRLYAAMGFELILLPVSAKTLEEIERFAEQGRRRNHRLYTPARPRRRFRRMQKERQAREEASS